MSESLEAETNEDVSTSDAPTAAGESSASCAACEAIQSRIQTYLEEVRTLQDTPVEGYDANFERMRVTTQLMRQTNEVSCARERACVRARECVRVRVCMCVGERASKRERERRAIRPSRLWPKQGHTSVIFKHEDGIICIMGDMRRGCVSPSVGQLIFVILRLVFVILRL